MYRLDLALIHGARDRGACHKVRAVFGKNRSLADSSHTVAGASDALHSAGDRGWCFDLHDEINRSHVDAELERRGRDQPAQRSHLQAVFDLFALRHGHAAVMRANQNLASEIVNRARNTFGQPAIIDEDDG